MKSLFYNRKLVVSIFVILIVAATALALGPMVYSMFAGSGVKTEPVNAEGADAASTDVNGNWNIVHGPPDNHTSAGFTFDEILPAERTTTSGSTNEVTGTVTVDAETLTDAEVTVNMTELSTDKQVRDQNMKSKLFETDKFPEATFKLTEPADLSAVPDDGTMGTVELTGDLTIKGETNEIVQEVDVLRTGENVVIGGNVPINRLDYGVESPELIAAEIDEHGYVDIRLFLEKN